MEIPHERPRHASLPSEHTDAARMSPVDDVYRAPTDNNLATSVTTVSKASMGAGQTEASNTETVATAPSNLTLVPRGIGQPSSLAMTEAEAEQAVREMPGEIRFIQDYNKWTLVKETREALDKYLKFDQSATVPSTSNATLEEHSREAIPVISLGEWPVWISEVKDDAIRSRLTKWLLSELQKEGLDPAVYAKPLVQQLGPGGPGKKGSKRERNDDTLLFDDMIETSTFVVSSTCRLNIKITKKEFLATGVSIDAVNYRIAIAGGHADGNKIYKDYIQTREQGRINVSDWKNCTALTNANPHGRDLFVYALHEVQLAKDETKKLQGYLRQHKALNQKRNTNARIAECSAKINHWLALAVELDKVRPRVEPDTVENSEVESETANASASARDVGQDEHVTLMSSNANQDNERNIYMKTLLSNPKLKVPYDSSQDPRHVTPNTPTVQRVRLRPPKPPSETDGRNKQEIKGSQKLLATRQPKRNVVAILDDSDSDFQVGKEVKPQAAKRMKTNDEAGTEPLGKQPTATSTKQISGYSAPPQSSFGNAAHSIRDLSETDQQKREIYLRKHFLPKLNAILKPSGIAHVRIVPKEWDVIKSKLAEAGVTAKERNELLRQFKFGWTQTPNLNGSIAEESISTYNSSALSPLAATPSTDTAPKDELIVTLRVPKGFNPADYSLNEIYKLPGFRYKFHVCSTIQERIHWAPIIAENVAKTMCGKGSAEWPRTYGQYKGVRNEDGKLVANGYWDHFLGNEAELGNWLWYGDPEELEFANMGRNVDRIE